jgi:hypothetical protein
VVGDFVSQDKLSLAHNDDASGLIVNLSIAIPRAQVCYVSQNSHKPGHHAWSSRPRTVLAHVPIDLDLQITV